MDSNLIQSFLDPRLWPEGSYELGFVPPSVLLSGHFLGIGSLVFSETQHGVRGPCVVVRERARMFEKHFFAQNMGKMGQKSAKIGFLNLLENLDFNFF